MRAGKGCLHAPAATCVWFVTEKWLNPVSVKIKGKACETIRAHAPLRQKLGRGTRLGRQLPGSGTAAASRAAYNRTPSFGEAPRARSEARDVQPDLVLRRPRTVCAVGRSTQSPGRIAPLFFCSPAASSLPWVCVRRADCLTDTANFAFMPMEYRSLLSSTVNVRLQRLR